MRKRTVEKLTVGGFGLCVLGFLITLLTAAGSTGVTGLVAGVLFGYLILMGGFVLQTVAWVGTLIAQAKRQQWGWFVCTILFGLWLYLLIVPETPEPEPARPAAFPYSPAQGYMPGQPYAPMQGYAPGQPSIPASYALPGQPSQPYQSQTISPCASGQQSMASLAKRTLDILENNVLYFLQERENDNGGHQATA